MDDQSIVIQAEEILYHYTSMDSFLKIIQNNCLWASDLNVVNDPAELAHVRNRFYELCATYGRSESLSLAQDPARCEFGSGLSSLLQGYVEKHWDDFAGRVFVTSFCRNGDLLSQWRAYGLEGNGVCIGFSADVMKICFGESASLVRVDYTKSGLDAFLKNVLEEAFKAYDPQSTDLKTVAPSLNHIIKSLADNAYRFKVPAFSEEVESRLVSILSGLPWDNPWRIELRVKDNNLIPYVINRTTDGLLPIREVITGPAFKSPSSLYALQGFLYNKGHRAIKLKTSQFTLR